MCVLQGGEFYYNTLPSVTHSGGKVLPAIPKRKLRHFPPKNINLFNLKNHILFKPEGAKSTLIFKLKI